MNGKWPPTQKRSNNRPNRHPWRSTLATLSVAMFLTAAGISAQQITPSPLTSSIAIHMAGWGRGKAGPASGLPEGDFYVEPIFLTMTEVGDHAFGVLETDMVIRYLTHGIYASDSNDGFGLDHAYFTLNKGFFLLNDGRGGNIDWGLGLDFDWRRADVLPREGSSPTLSQKMVGGGIVTRLKMSAGSHFMASPAFAYDIYVLPHNQGDWASGHGFRLDCDLWISPWPGPYTMTLQPFLHWRSWNGSSGAHSFEGAKSRVYGVKMGFGIRPTPFVPQY